MRSLKRKSPKAPTPSKTPTFNAKTPQSKESNAFFGAKKIQRKEEAPKEEMKDEKAQKKEEKMEEEKAVQKMEKEDQKAEKETDI